VKRHKPRLAMGRCCWVCGKPGGEGSTLALRLVGYDVPKHGVIAYAHGNCLARARRKALSAAAGEES
jgi:hypothetical protein